MPRKARKISSSGIYHIMLRSVNRQNIFIDDADRNKFLKILGYCKYNNTFKLYAYCLMGNHIHLLIQETETPVSKIVQQIASRFVYWYNAKYDRCGHLFQGRYRSEPVENDSYFLTVLRYIHQNPVKAGFCTDINDYQYSSFKEYTGMPFLVDTEYVFDILPKDKFIEFNYETISNDCLDISVRTRSHITDEQAQEIIDTYPEFNESPEELGRYIKMFYAQGISIRQIANLCDIQKSTIEKILKQ